MEIKLEFTTNLWILKVGKKHKPTYHINVKLIKNKKLKLK